MALAEALTPTPFEGETTINSQSDYARELLATAIGSTPSIGQNAEIKSALGALGELVTQQGQSWTTVNSQIDRSLADFDSETLERPPWAAAMNVLDKATKYPTMAFAVIFPFLRMGNLNEIFEDVYQRPGTCGAARRILAFGIMENLFTEFKGFPAAEMDVSNFSAYSLLCKQHLEVALSQLDLFMPATYENIMALVLGTAQAIELCKPSLCWVLVSSAASLCQNLGYHRINTMTNDTPEVRQSKIHVFWMIYIFDKTLSLRLGRASAIQDWDISLPFVLPSDATPRGPEGGQILTYWIKVARIQGQTYEKLFSPAAFLRTPAERTRTAVELVNAMSLAWYERGEACITDLAEWSSYRKGNSPPSKLNMHTSPNETELPSKRKHVNLEVLGLMQPNTRKVSSDHGCILVVIAKRHRVIREGPGHLLPLRRCDALLYVRISTACSHPGQRHVQPRVRRVVSSGF